MKNYIAICTALAVCLILIGTTRLFASEQTNLIGQATATADHLRKDPAFGLAHDMMNRARGVLIVPALVKGGFLLGAEGGSGVLVARNEDGWSQPAFYSMRSGSFGLQAGLQKAEIVMLVMSDKALAAMQKTAFKLGAGPELTVITAEAATNLSGDIIIWTSGTGLCGGIALNGSIIKPRDSWNRIYYGGPVSVSDILGSKVENAASSPLRQELAALK